MSVQCTPGFCCERCGIQVRDHCPISLVRYQLSHHIYNAFNDIEKASYDETRTV